MKNKRKRSSLESKQSRYGYAFLAPFLIGGIFFIIYPLITAILYCFSKVELNDAGTRLVNHFIGLENFNNLFFVDTSFRQIVLKSLGDMFINVPIVVIFAFFMASVLNTKFRGRGIARAIMFLPVITAAGMVLTLQQNDLAQQIIGASDRFSVDVSSNMQVSTAFGNMLLQMNMNTTLINFLVGAVDRISQITTMSAVSIVIFLAGLQGISPSIFEAAYIEGATKWEVFWKISFPMVSPLILLSVVYSVVDSFTNPQNQVIYTIHQNIIGASYELATTQALSYSLIIIAILAVFYAVISRRVFYYD